MKKFMFLFVAALVLVTTGCSKIDNANQTENMITELNLSIEGGTKVAVTKDNTGLKFAWKNEDVVYVFPAKSGNTTAVVFIYDSSTDKFTSGTGLTAGADYYAVYGSSQLAEKFNTDGEVKAAMNIAFYCSLDQLPMVSDIFTATADGTFATLHHTCGVVEIPFTGSGSIYDISINAYNSTTGDKYLRGNYNVTFAATGGKIESIVKGSDNNYTRVYDSEYMYNSAPLTLSSTPQSVYIPVLPGSYDKVFIAWNNDANEIATNLSFTVERGKVHKKSTPINYNVE